MAKKLRILCEMAICPRDHRQIAMAHQFAHRNAIDATRKQALAERMSKNCAAETGYAELSKPAPDGIACPRLANSVPEKSAVGINFRKSANDFASHVGQVNHSVMLYFVFGWLQDNSVVLFLVVSGRN